MTGLSAPANAVETLLANTINAETRLIRGRRSFAGIPAIRKRALFRFLYG